MNSKIVLDLPPTQQSNRNSEGSFVRLSNDKILFVYTQYTTGGSNDNAPASLAFCISADEGETWSEPKLMIDRGNADNIMSVSLLRLQSGKIALLYLRKKRRVDANGDFILFDCIPVFRYSTDDAKTWSEEKVCCQNCGYYVGNNDRLIQLKSGRLMFPLAFHRSYANFCDGRAIALTIYSDDEGLTWHENFGWVLPGDQGGHTGMQEPGILELNDGRLLLWARTDRGCQYKSYSSDNGQSWSPAEKYLEFPGPAAPLSIKRSPYKDVLVAVWCDHSSRRDALPPPSDYTWGRTPFSMVLSHDDAKTWTDHQFVETDPKHGYCYTAIFFTKDNSVLLGYCCGGEGETQCCLERTCVRKIHL